MTPFLITMVLTVLAAVDVVLTRVRLTRDSRAAGRVSIPRGLLNLHTSAGLVALLTWVPFLVLDLPSLDLPGSDLLGPERTWLGVIGLVAWWVTAVAGLLVLVRWLPAKGRHSSAPSADTWGEGPGLSVLAHVGLLVGVIVFTVLFLVGSIP